MKKSAKCGTIEPAIFGALTNDNASNHKENNPSVVAYPGKVLRGAVPSDTLIGEPSIVEGFPDHTDKSPNNPVFKETSPECGKCSTPEGNPGNKPPIPESDDRAPIEMIVCEKSSKYPEMKNSKGPGAEYPKNGTTVLGVTS